MWGKLETWGRGHPFALGLVIFLIGAVLLYLFARGRSASSGAAQPSDAYYQAQAAVAASGNQLQAAQIAAQAHANDTNASLQAVQTQIGGQVTIADIQSKQAVSIASLGADVQKQAISAQQEMTDTASTLTAQVQNAGINAQVQINAQNNNAVTQQTTTAANEQLGIAALNAQVVNSSYQALAADRTINANLAAYGEFVRGVGGNIRGGDLSLPVFDAQGNVHYGQ